ncbi:Unhealthy ribosome biogenesis protein 2 [Liparis tanakae]|uniref:Unhealthy ribosome biogenesis protein 2 n=1 Tax=Liparis tanakae TaxID=230148 RepID=A0A4Z2EI01_9TELE|nr:Unhealthy ribosome biogenesis protein 2 [Liparis tanakae]
MLLCLNHLILEPDLDQLLSSAWVHSGCIEARVQRARQLMVCSLLQTYTKLRQMPHLFSELLSVICQPALGDLRPLLLSESISASLRTCLLDTPASQGLEICSLVLESIKGCILPGLAREEREAEKMEVDGGGNDDVEDREMDLERNDASMKLFSLSHLLNVVLFSLKTLDSASPVTIVRQSQGVMEVMQQVAMELLHLLETEKRNRSSAKRTPGKGKKDLELKESEIKAGAAWEQKTQEAALLLRYTWVEVDTLFSIHCSKYTSLQTAAASQPEDGAPVLTQMQSLLSGEIAPAGLPPSRRPMSALLLKLLALQQMKKALLDGPALSEPGAAELLTAAAQFILAKSELRASADGEQAWDGQVASVNASSSRVAHWHLVTSNLPLIAPYLSGEDVGGVADALLLQSPVLAELPSLFSATVRSLTRRIVGVLKAAHAAKACPTLLKYEETGIGASAPESDGGDQPAASTHREAIVQDILASSKTGEAFVLLTAAQRSELVDALQILTNLNPDGMNSEDLSSVFLLLLFMLTSTASRSDPAAAADPAGSGDDALFLLELLNIMTCLLEGRNFQSVLKLIHGGTLLQASVASLLWHSSNGRFQATGGSEWLDFIKAVQSFIRSLVQLIIIRNSSIRLNLDQFASYLTSKEMSNMQIVADKPGASISSVHILLASLTSFSQAMTSNLGRRKPIDQTLTQMLTRMTASLGPAVEAVLKPQTVSQSVIQPACILGQAFMVEVVTVMLHCELSSRSVEDESKPADTQFALSHMTLYQGFCRQILKEISSAHRPLDFLVSSLHFLSAFYKAVEKTREEREVEQHGKEKAEKELNELYMQILQNVHRLLTASWLSEDDVGELEPAVQELLRHLLEKSTTGRFNLLLLLIREGLVTGKLRAGNYRVRRHPHRLYFTLSICIYVVYIYIYNYIYIYILFYFVFYISLSILYAQSLFLSFFLIFIFYSRVFSLLVLLCPQISPWGLIKYISILFYYVLWSDV